MSLHTLAIIFPISLGLLAVAMIVAYLRHSWDYDRFAAKLAEELGRPPTDDELRAFAHDVPAATLRKQ